MTLNRHEILFISISVCVAIQLTLVNSEYIAKDDPECQDNCMDLNGPERESCFNKLIDYHSYRLVTSLFNFGKVSVYNGLWLSRYEHPDPNLFESVFNATLNKYNDDKLLGILKYSELVELAKITYDQFLPYTEKEVEYMEIPSLKCPVTCTYDLVTWQSLFYTSLAIFLLAIITIGLYSIFLHKQYKSLTKRLKS